MKVIVYTRADGGVSRVDFGDKLPGETDEEQEARIITRHMAWRPDLSNLHVCDSAELPDRMFRKSWRQSGKGVPAIDLDAAKQEFEDNLTAAKRIKARELIERETAGENVAAEKAALQAINPRNLANGKATVADLKAAWPETVRKS